MNFTMKLAEISFGVTCLHGSTKTFCADYLTDDAPAFAVALTREDIDREREIARRQDIWDGVPVRVFTDAYLETIALYRKLAEPLLNRRCMIFHGAVAAVDGECYLFTAKSGTGKTTHTKLWEKNIPNSYILSGDKPLIQVGNRSIITYGTPWRGKEAYGVNQGLPLKAVCVLQRSRDNHIEAIEAGQAYPVLYQQAHHVESVEGMELTMQLLDTLARQVPMYRLGCNMQDEAALLAYRAMSGRNGT